MPNKKAARKSPESPEALDRAKAAAAYLREAARFDRDNPPGEVDPETGKRYIPPELRSLGQIALRLALTLNGAPGRCRRRACAGGRCQIQLDHTGDRDCKGGITEAALRDTALMLVFAGALGKHYCHWIPRE